MMMRVGGTSTSTAIGGWQTGFFGSFSYSRKRPKGDRTHLVCNLIRSRSYSPSSLSEEIYSRRRGISHRKSTRARSMNLNGKRKPNTNFLEMSFLMDSKAFSRLCLSSKLFVTNNKSIYCWNTYCLSEWHSPGWWLRREESLVRKTEMVLYRQWRIWCGVM